MNDYDAPDLQASTDEAMACAQIEMDEQAALDSAPVPF